MWSTARDGRPCLVSPGFALYELHDDAVFATPFQSDVGRVVEDTYWRSVLPLFLQHRGAQALHASAVMGTDGVVGIGASNWTPGGGSEWGNEWFFAANFGGGVTVFFSETVGLQLQARALFPMSFSGGGFWCGTGGCSVGIGSYGFIAQFDFTAGLTIALGGKKKK